MKIYHYDDIKKANQALGSFHRNNIPVEDTVIRVIDGKPNFYLLANPPYSSKKDSPKKDSPKKEKSKKKVEKKDTKKKKTKKEDKKKK